jgi:hypothetical protein
MPLNDAQAASGTVVAIMQIVRNRPIIVATPRRHEPSGRITPGFAHRVNDLFNRGCLTRALGVDCRRGPTGA